jgi:cellulose synthase/poly-beta-1,6-N-acetylglucosamine synthase-like glycosyltransferase
MQELSVFEIIVVVVVAFYILQQIVFLIGFRKKLSVDEKFEPTVTIIVAARNEERNIKNCLASLSKINYPKEKLEILIVDDFSTDRTGEFIDEFTKQFEFIRKIIPKKNIIEKPGKANAVVNALEIANGEIVFTTDADCIVKPDWIKTQIKYFTKNVGVVCGFTLQKSYSQFTGMQNLDWIYLLTVASGAINLGIPLSCIGNNMAYRRKAYDLVGGYQKMKFSVTEDFALLHKIHSDTAYKIVYPAEVSAVNLSEPCQNFRTLYRQKHRWGTGGLESKFEGFFVMSWGFLSHLLFLLQILWGTTFTLTLMLLKIISDLIFLSNTMKQFRVLNQLKYFIVFEIYFTIYVLLLPILVVVDKKVVWKERQY